MNFKKLLVCCILMLIPISVLSWNGRGHILIAQIAYEQLTPVSKKEIDQLSISLNALDSRINHYIACATWPDDLKRNNVHAFDTWHYITLGFSNDGTKIPLPKKSNAVSAISKMTDTLKNKSLPPNERALALAMLTHLIGDIHQPMHTATKFTRKHPKGDAGGNGFILKGKYRNLHSLWDAAVGIYSKNPPRPLSDQSMQEIKNQATLLVAEYPLKDSQRLTRRSAAEWAQESHKMALVYAYDGIRANTYPSSDYKERGSKIAQEQIVVAGYRLAMVLNEIFN